MCHAMLLTGFGRFDDGIVLIWQTGHRGGWGHTLSVDNTVHGAYDMAFLLSIGTVPLILLVFYLSFL